MEEQQITQEEIIQKNKERFISLVRSITRPDAEIDALINKLENSDFFTAPASTQYHCSYVGGLCAHSLHVYDQLLKLVSMEYNYNIEESEVGVAFPVGGVPYNRETLIIVALFHDISKMNFYEIAERNVKDEQGKWTKVPFIKVKEAKDRFIYSSHGANSEYMIGRFIPLTREESAAIISHMGWSDNQFNATTVSEIFNRYSLATLLHTADVLATFIDEAI